MPYAYNQGTRIHYEIEGSGPPLVLQYGQYFPLEIWYELNYVDALRKDCRLILVDARGHGASDKPHDPAAYRIERMVADILAVLDDLGIQKANYMGYSSGGYLGWALARYAPERLCSLILGGTQPYSEEESESTWKDDQIRSLEKQTADEFAAGLENFLVSLNFPPLSPRMQAALRLHDTRALIAWLQGSSGWPGFADILPSISVPCLLYAGENTEEYPGAREAAQHIPGATFVGIPNGEHLEGGTWIELLLPHILQVINKEV